MHSAWNDDETNLWFECSGADAYAGHMHAERNSFDFFALGRSWAIAPGYHITPSDFQSSVQVRDPRYANDPATAGFIGESPSSATQRPPLPGNHPNPPGRILEMTEAPDHAWTLIAGDATLAYTYGFHTSERLIPGCPSRPFSIQAWRMFFWHVTRLFVKNSPRTSWSLKTITIRCAMPCVACSSCAGQDRMP